MKVGSTRLTRIEFVHRAQRLWLSSMAYVLMCAVRRIGLAGSKLERATCGTIQQQLF